jgi:hypothetical protein
MCSWSFHVVKLLSGAFASQFDRVGIALASCFNYLSDRFAAQLPLALPPTYRGTTMRIHYAVLASVEYDCVESAVRQCFHVRCPFRVMPCPPHLEPAPWQQLCRGTDVA